MSASTTKDGGTPSKPTQPTTASPPIVLPPTASASAVPSSTATTASAPKKKKSAAGYNPNAKKLDPAEVARLEAERVAAEKAAEYKAAIEDIPHQQMIKVRLQDVKARNALLASNLSALHDSLHQSDIDSTDVLKYLENEVRRKDILTKKLSKEIKELYEKQVKEKKEKNEEYTKEIANLEQIFVQKERELLDLNRVLHQEYNDLILFQKIRQELNAELTATKGIILKNEKRHALQMSDLEKKFMLARNKLLQESSDRIAESRKNYKEEVGRELDLESKFISNENEKMKKELEFHQTLIEKLQSSNSELQSIVNELEQSVRSLELKDVTYASNSLKNVKLIDEFKRKWKILDASLKEVEAERLKQQQMKRQSIPTLPPEHQQVKDELMKIQALTLGRLRENSTIQHQLTLFSSQRNDVEIFFLEALNIVKREILVRRKREYERELRAYHDKLQELAQELYQPRGSKLFQSTSASSSQALTSAVLVTSDPRLPPPQPPQLDASKLKLEDFTLHDRERVLQILFEKLNAQSGHHASGTNAAAGATASQFPSRTSSALSLYTGGGSSSTSLVVSRPQSSTRPIQPHRPSSRPPSSTKPQQQSSMSASASKKRRPLSGSQQSPPQSQSTFVTQADFRPSEFTQLDSYGQAKLQSRQKPSSNSRSNNRPAQTNSNNPAHEEKDTTTSPFFPFHRGDTPSELL